MITIVNFSVSSFLLKILKQLNLLLLQTIAASTPIALFKSNSVVESNKPRKVFILFSIWFSIVNYIYTTSLLYIQLVTDLSYIIHFPFKNVLLPFFFTHLSNRNSLWLLSFASPIKRLVIYVNGRTFW